MRTLVKSRFAALLGENRLKISEVSRATGISRTTLTNLYYQKSEFISFRVLGALCEYFNCSVSDIIDTTHKEAI